MLLATSKSFPSPSFIGNPGTSCYGIPVPEFHGSCNSQRGQSICINDNFPIAEAKNSARIEIHYH